jgi:hypothetical protein
MFANWCALKGEQALPASPAAIGKFIDDIAALGIEKVWDQVQQIRREHYVRELGDPTLGPGPVADAINRISKVVAPRSWRAEARAEFMSLPWPVQVEISKRETERDREVRRLQNESADIRRELERLIKENNEQVTTTASAVDARTHH